MHMHTVTFDSRVLAILKFGSGRRHKIIIATAPICDRWMCITLSASVFVSALFTIKFDNSGGDHVIELMW
jgi:hypothetical protein